MKHIEALIEELELSAVMHTELADEAEAGELDMRAAAQLRTLMQSLEVANDSCRSAMAIARRKGEETNWDAFTASLDKSLGQQHRAMYPEQYLSETTS